MTVIVSLVIALALFGLSFLSRRRFGVLGLALAAGALLASQMTKDLSRLISQYDIPVEPLSAISAASIFLTLLPALILLLGGPSYKKRKQAITGAIAFTVMAMLLILEPLTGSMSPDRLMEPFVNWVSRYDSLLLAVGIGFAVMDAWMINIAPSPDETKKK
jgi:hypothetical protein